MKRLAEISDFADDSERSLAELVREAEPFVIDPFRKRRVLSRVLRPGAPRRHWLMRPVVITIVVFGTAMTAAASWGGKAALGGDGGFTPARDRIESEVQHARTRALTAAAASRKVTPPSTEEQPTAPVAPEKVASTPRTRATPSLSAGSPEDPKRVMDAMYALRKERDPARAQALLEEHLREHPHGALAEDALALSIEAAAARHDPKAKEYARRYLAKYPQGRFKPLAQRVLSQP